MTSLKSTAGGLPTITSEKGTTEQNNVQYEDTIMFMRMQSCLWGVGGILGWCSFILGLVTRNICCGSCIAQLKWLVCATDNNGFGTRKRHVKSKKIMSTHLCFKHTQDNQWIKHFVGTFSQVAITSGGVCTQLQIYCRCTDTFNS